MAKATKNAVKGSKKVTKSAKVQPSKNGSVNNPFRSGGGYHASVEALRTLGIGKMHPAASIIKAVRASMGSAYREFAAKDARNKETGKDASGRILQNVMVVSRKDYGKPLREVGFEVRWNGRDKEATAGLFKLGKK